MEEKRNLGAASCATARSFLEFLPAFGYSAVNKQRHTIILSKRSYLESSITGGPIRITPAHCTSGRISGAVTTLSGQPGMRRLSFERIGEPFPLLARAFGCRQLASIRIRPKKRHLFSFRLPRRQCHARTRLGHCVFLPSVAMIHLLVLHRIANISSNSAHIITRRPLKIRFEVPRGHTIIPLGRRIGAPRTRS
jgi:hypothetical protein